MADVIPFPAGRTNLDDPAPADSMVRVAVGERRCGVGEVLMSVVWSYCDGDVVMVCTVPVGVPRERLCRDLSALLVSFGADAAPTPLPPRLL